MPIRAKSPPYSIRLAPSILLPGAGGVEGCAPRSSQGRDVAPRPTLLALFPEGIELSGRDRRAQARHQLLVKGHIDGGEQDRAEHLVRLHEMMQVGARIVAGGRAAAGLVERPRIARMTRVLEVDRPEA